jgi:hypothetical protein
MMQELREPQPGGFLVAPQLAYTILGPCGCIGQKA